MFSCQMKLLFSCQMKPLFSCQMKLLFSWFSYQMKSCLLWGKREVTNANLTTCTGQHSASPHIFVVPILVCCLLAPEQQNVWFCKKTDMFELTFILLSSSNYLWQPNTLHYSLHSLKMVLNKNKFWCVSSSEHLPYYDQITVLLLMLRDELILNRALVTLTKLVITPLCCSLTKLLCIVIQSKSGVWIK